MPASSVVYLLPFLASAILSSGLAFYALNFIRARGAMPFIIMTLAQSAWTIFMILEIISPTLEGKRFWDSMQWAMIFTCMVSAYWFTQSILPPHRAFRIPRWLVVIFPIVFMLLLMNYPVNFYPNERILVEFPFNDHDFNFSLPDWVAFIYVYAILISCIVSLYREYRQTTGQVRDQLMWTFAGVSVQAIMYFLFFITTVNILGQRDTAPFTFLVGNAILGWGFFRYGFFDLSPLARSQVVENMPDAFILTDAHGKIVDMNAIAKLHSPPDSMNQNITDVFKEWVGEMRPERLSTPFTQDYVRTINGERKSLEMSVSPLQNSRQDIMGYLVVVRDITARKVLESALAASEERYRSIIESMAEGVVLHDDVGQILMCNQAAESILGITYDRIEGENIRDMVQYTVREDLTPFRPESLPLLTTLQTGESIRDVIIGVQRPDHHVRWLLINTQPFVFIDQDMKENRQVVISFRDVTDLRRMQAEATRAEIAQNRAQMLAQFIQSASHEFRTPLALIGTSLYMITRQSDPDKRQHHVQIAEHEIRHIERLLETLVNMVQLDSGVPLKRVPTDIQPLLQAVVLQHTKVARDHQITLQFNASDALPIIDIEPHYLTVGIKQVLDNAIRYTPDGGTVTIEVTSEQDTLFIKVRDSGSGIAADELKHIFDRFWRHDAAHSTPGFGLGLSIAQKVFERHDGAIQIESEEGSGTTVTMKLPLQPSTVGTKSDNPV